MGLQAPKERRLTRSLAAISLGRLPAGRAGRQGEGGKEREAMGREPTGDAGSQGEGGTLDTHGQNLFWDGPATGEGRRAKEREAKRMSWELLACSFRRCKQYTMANLSSIQSRVFLHLGKLFMLSSQSYFVSRNIAQKEGSRFFPTAFLGCTRSFSVLQSLPGITAHSA